jgi:hypothetical protein
MLGNGTPREPSNHARFVTYTTQPQERAKSLTATCGCEMPAAKRWWRRYRVQSGRSRLPRAVEDPPPMGVLTSS